MFYEPYNKKKRQGKRRHGCLFRFFRMLFTLAALCVVIAIASDMLLKGNPFGGGELNVNRNLPGGWTNILLLGSDMEEGGGSRTDSILIASISDGGRVKLTSVMRDTMVEIEGHGRTKLNAAYRFGGPELTMKVVNAAFGMNITRYVVVDFQGFAELIDAVGGIEMTITREERDELNKNVRSAIRDFGGKPSDFVPLNEYGENTHLNGARALGYARIRSLDSDYMRASRQRKVLDALFVKVKQTRNPLVFAQLARAGLANTKTNIGVAQLAVIAGKALMGGADMEQFRIPAEGTYTSGAKDGVWSIETDFVENQKKLITFIYGT